MKALSFGREQVNAEVLQRLLDAEAAGYLDRRSGAGCRSSGGCSLRLSNANQRRVASRILSPIDGTVVKMAQTGAGETVRPGEKLVRISPNSTDRAIEMVADGIDAPLLNVGRKVKILFYGIPAIPLPAWPEMMAGTYNRVIRSSTRSTTARAISASGSSPILKNVPGLRKKHVRQGTKRWDGLFSIVSRCGTSSGADSISFRPTTRNGPEV